MHKFSFMNQMHFKTLQIRMSKSNLQSVLLSRTVLTDELGNKSLQTSWLVKLVEEKTPFGDET